MAKKAFDILPPYPAPKKYHHHENKSKKEKEKSKKTFYFFIFGLFFIFAIFTLIKMGDLSAFSSSVPSVAGPNTNKSSTDNNNSNFELFNESGGPVFSNTNIIKIRIYNGATDTSDASIVKDTLLKAGYQIEKSDIAANASDKTVIYYKKGDKAIAQKVADTLKSKIDVNMEESSNLESSYDILVLVGKN